MRANNRLDVIHTNLCGPMKNMTHFGNCFFITFIDDYSWKAHVYFLKHKNEAFNKFLEFKVYAEKQLDYTSKQYNLTEEGNMLTITFKIFSSSKEYDIKPLLHICLSKMALLNALTEPLWKWQE